MHPEEKKNHAAILYTRARIHMARAYTSEQYEKAAELFSGIAGYRDAAVLAEECRKTAVECLKKAGEDRKSRVCNDIRNKMAEDALSEYKDALILLKMVPEWEEAAWREAECHKRIAEITARDEADRIESERLAELARQKAARIARRKRNFKIFTAAAVVLCIAFTFAWIYVIDPALRYNDALELMEAGNVVGAFETWEALEDYKDSAAKAAVLFDEYKVEKMKIAGVGDRVFFGTYEQDGSSANGLEAVEWIVLEATDEQLLIISKYALDRLPYHTQWDAVTWEICTLRSWLNNDFLNAAFSAEEQAQLLTVTVSADANPEYGTDPGNATQDKVFLLSITEAANYFDTNAARQCKPTAYALANGSRVNKKGYCDWWLRTPGFEPTIVTSILDNGQIFEGGSIALNARTAVRPVIRIEREP